MDPVAASHRFGLGCTHGLFVAFVTVRDAMLDNATTAGIDGRWLGYVQSANRLAEVAIVTLARLVDV